MDVVEGEALVTRIDDLIHSYIEDAFAIDRDVIRLFISPSKNQRANLVHLALPVVIHDLILFHIRPTYSVGTFLHYLETTGKYAPITGEEAKEMYVRAFRVWI